MQFLEPRLLYAGNTWNVTNFGANPADNGGDDWFAIQAAINTATSGDTIFFPAGTYQVNSFSGTGGVGKLITKSGLTFLGTTQANPNKPQTPDDISILKGHDSFGPLIHFNTDGITFSHMRFDQGGLFFDKSGSYNANIIIDNCEFRLDTGGADNNGITSTVGLRNSTISNNLFTSINYHASFGIFGYGRDHLTVANNEFINLPAAIHMESFGPNDTGTVFEQNFISGVKGMGIELQRYGINTIIQDNWYEHPNLSTNKANNTYSMAYSLILEQSTNTIARRNVVYAPERPDGIGTRLGIELGGDNALVEDNYMNFVNNTVANNDATGTTSGIVRNNQLMNYFEGVRISFPSSNPSRTLTISNNGPNVALTWAAPTNPADQVNGLGRGKPQRNVRFTIPGDPTSPPPPPPPPDSPPPPPPATIPNSPSNLQGTVSPGMNTINFTWQDNSNDETDFIIQMLADDGITWVSLASVGQDVTSFTLNSVAAGKTYNFRVISHNTAGYSDPSSPTTVSTPLSDIITVGTITTASKRTKPSLISAGTAVSPPQTATS